MLHTDTSHHIKDYHHLRFQVQTKSAGLSAKPRQQCLYQTYHDGYLQTPLVGKSDLNRPQVPHYVRHCLSPTQISPPGTVAALGLQPRCAAQLPGSNTLPRSAVAAGQASRATPLSSGPPRLSAPAAPSAPHPGTFRSPRPGTARLPPAPPKGSGLGPPRGR